MNGKKDNPIRLLLKWAGKDKYYLYLSIFCSFISGLCIMVPYYSMYQLIDAAYKGILNKEILFKNSMVIACSIVIRFMLFGISGILSHKGAYNSLYKVRCMVIDHMAKVPLGVLNQRNTGDIKTVLNEDIEQLELFLAHHLPELIYYMCGPVAVFIYLCTVNTTLAILTLIPLVLAFIVMGSMFRGMDSMMERANKSIVKLNSAIIEYINGMRLIKAYNMSSKSFKKYSDAINEENAIWNKIAYKMGPFYATYVIIIECGMIIMVPLGGVWFLRGYIGASTFLLFVFVGSLYLTELRPLQELGSNFAKVLKGITKTKEILDIPIYTGEIDFPHKHNIILDNVTFSYDGSKNILENCTLKIKEGEKVALVGKSGAGKSTIIQLISRFYDVQKGSVSIGGVDVKEIDYKKLLGQIAMVFQKTFLTRDSVFENIRMGSNATLEQVREAAKQAQIDDFIMSLPSAYETKVGNFGSRFSGGEKQRIAIARAILKNSPILILDEATSAADPENQVEIDKAIRNLCKDKTVIIVAHRLGAIKMCDRVAVVENGRVSCIGTHEEVLKNNDYYQQAWHDYELARSMKYKLQGDELI